MYIFENNWWDFLRYYTDHDEQVCEDGAALNAKAYECDDLHPEVKVLKVWCFAYQGLQAEERDGDKGAHHKSEALFCIQANVEVKDGKVRAMILSIRSMLMEIY